MAAGAAAAAAGSRWWLLGIDGDALGFDVWYYVLQVRSLQAGADLFHDDSWAFVVLRAAAWLCGDVVQGNELVATVCSALVAAALALAGHRLGGRGGALAVTAVAVASTGHMALSVEFLKNAVGAVPLAVVAALVVAPEQPSRRRWGLAVAAAVVAVMVHKLAGALALGWLLVQGTATMAGHSARAASALLVGGGVAAVTVALVGVVGLTDLERVVSIEGPLVRARRLGELGVWEQVEMVGVHLAPLAALAAWWRGLAPSVALALGAVAVVCAAPGLPFDFDAVAWRLLCMGFVPLALLVAALRPSVPLAALLVACGLVATVTTVDARRRRTPDYQGWQSILPVVRAEVPVGGRLVAHRGLCGFLWAEGGRRCENFEPQGDLGSVWRVTYGFSEAALARYAKAVPLRPGYLLVHEPDWQRFRAEQGDRFPLARHPRNPWRPRPAYVKIADLPAATSP